MRSCKPGLQAFNQKTPDSACKPPLSVSGSLRLIVSPSSPSLAQRQHQFIEPLPERLRFETVSVLGAALSFSDCRISDKGIVVTNHLEMPMKDHARMLWFAWFWMLLITIIGTPAFGEPVESYPLDIPRARFLATILPFGNSKTFTESGVQIPRAGYARTYDKSIVIAWAGQINKESYFEAINRAAKTFSGEGYEVHAFLSANDRRFYGPRYEVAKAASPVAIAHDTDVRELKHLVDTIELENRGKKVLVWLFFSSHGGWEKKGGYQNGERGPMDFMVAGPFKRADNGQEYNHGIENDLLAYMAEKLKSFDIRLITGCCYGSNIDDLFQQSYLRARHEAGMSADASVCSSVLAGWNMGAWHLGCRTWESSFLMAPSGFSFLQSSFFAMQATRLGRLGISDCISDWASYLNVGMTTSERLLYNWQLHRMKKLRVWKGDTAEENLREAEELHATPQQIATLKRRGAADSPFLGIPANGTDELENSFFDLAQANSAMPADQRYHNLYQRSKQQTEEFFRRIGLSENVKKHLGLNERCEVNFAAAKVLLARPLVNDANEIRNSKTIGHPLDQKTKIFALGLVNTIKLGVGTGGDAGILENSLFELDQQLQKDPMKNRFDVYGNGKSILTETQIRQRLIHTQQNIERILNGEYHKTQVVLVAIKRLGLMLDFLHNPDIHPRMKELFCFYRACELQPFLPKVARP